VSAASARRDERPYVAALVAATVAGVAIRIWLAFAAEGKSWSDMATIALMAMHELRGHFYAFYWGQAYMGSIESLAVAPFFALFGVSDVTLSMGLLPWYVLFSVALYLLVRRCGGPLAGAVAAGLLAFSPPYVQYQQIMPRGDYPETLAFGTWLLWLTLRITHDSQRDAAGVRRHLLAIAFVAGLAFWTNWLVFPYFAVVGIYLFLHDPRLPLRPVALSILAFFVLGSLPFWVYNVREGFPTFSFVEGVQTAEGRRVALTYALLGAIPQLLGFRDLNERFTFGWPGQALSAMAAATTVALLFSLRRSGLALLRGRVQQTDPRLVLVLLAGATISIYAIGLPGRFHVARYLLPLVTSTFALVALAVAWLSRRSRALAAGTLLLLLGFYAAQIIEFHHSFALAKERPGAGPVERLAAHLEKTGIRYGYADYGDATITTYLARERVVLTDYIAARYPLDEVDFKDPAVIVRQDAVAADGTLATINATYSVARIPGYRVYWPVRYDGVPRAPLPMRGWTITASEGAADASLMIDGDRLSYWSVPAKTHRPAVILDLGSEQTATGIFFDNGDRGSDAFEKLRIEASLDGEHWSLVKEAEWGFPVYFEPNGQVTTVPSNTQYVLFAPLRTRLLRMTLLEGDERYNWSIGELRVFGEGRADEPLTLPQFADPTSPIFVERRLRAQSSRDPYDDGALISLRRLYRSLGENDKLRDIERLEAVRFAPQTRLDWRFGGDLTLLGIDCRAAGPRQLEITYYWQATRTMDGDYAAYLRVGEGAGELHDDVLLGAPRTTSSWLAQEIVRQTRVVTLPRELRDGTHAANLGLWVPGKNRHVRLGSFGWWGPRTRTLARLEVRGDEVTVKSIGS
jgi:F5/8 type C domain/Dolichyl-phosphate-mannose-protein mannosyltransferase